MDVQKTIDKIPVICYWCMQPFKRGLEACPNCASPYDEKKSQEAKFRSTATYEQISVRNAIRDGQSVDKVKRIIQRAKAGYDMEVGEIASLNRQLNDYLNRKGVTGRYNSKWIRRKGQTSE